MTKEQAQEMITLLAREFRMRVPTLSWSARAKNGYANYSRHVIVSGPKAWRGAEACLVHEFAHLLTYRQYPPSPYVFRRRQHHGEEFMLCLRRVAAAWYGDPMRYPWATEYKRIAKVGAPSTPAKEPKQ